jgi:hypothetical protein
MDFGRNRQICHRLGKIVASDFPTAERSKQRFDEGEAFGK